MIPPGTEPPEHGTVVTIERHGRSYRIVNPGGLIGAPIADGRPYEARLLDVIYQRRLTGSALDVGAHVGNHALFFAAVCGLRVVAVEADPATYARLEENIGLNPGLRVEPLMMAAGASWRRGRIERGMRVAADDDGPVQVGPLDDVVDLVDLALVKVDVEGMEAEVLRGLARHLERTRPLVYAETHTRTAARSVTRTLAPLGYEPTTAVRMGSTMQCWEVPA